MFRSSGQNCWHNRLVRTAVETWWSNAGRTSEFSFHGSCQPVSNHSSGLAVIERGPDWSHRLRWKKVVVTLLRCLQRKKVYSPKMKWSNVVTGCHLTGRKAPQSSSDRGILGGFWRAKELQLLSYLGFSNVSTQSFFSATFHIWNIEGEVCYPSLIIITGFWQHAISEWSVETLFGSFIMCYLCGIFSVYLL